MQTAPDQEGTNTGVNAYPWKPGGPALSFP